MNLKNYYLSRRNGLNYLHKPVFDSKFRILVLELFHNTNNKIKKFRDLNLLHYGEVVHHNEQFLSNFSQQVSPLKPVPVKNPNTKTDYVLTNAHSLEFNYSDGTISDKDLDKLLDTLVPLLVHVLSQIRGQILELAKIDEKVFLHSYLFNVKNLFNSVNAKISDRNQLKEGFSDVEMQFLIDTIVNSSIEGLSYLDDDVFLRGDITSNKLYEKCVHYFLESIKTVISLSDENKSRMKENFNKDFEGNKTEFVSKVMATGTVALPKDKSRIYKVAKNLKQYRIQVADFRNLSSGTRKIILFIRSTYSK